MKIKIRRREFEVTSKDRIVDNGAVYIFITQTVFDGYHDIHLIFPKTLFRNLLKSGKIRKSKDKYLRYYDLYEFVDD